MNTMILGDQIKSDLEIIVTAVKPKGEIETSFVRSTDGISAIFQAATSCSAPSGTVCQRSSSK